MQEVQSMKQERIAKDIEDAMRAQNTVLSSELLMRIIEPDGLVIYETEPEPEGHRVGSGSTRFSGLAISSVLSGRVGGFSGRVFGSRFLCSPLQDNTHFL